LKNFLQNRFVAESSAWGGKFTQKPMWSIPYEYNIIWLYSQHSSEPFVGDNRPWYDLSSDKEA